MIISLGNNEALGLKTSLGNNKALSLSLALLGYIAVCLFNFYNKIFARKIICALSLSSLWYFWVLILLHSWIFLLYFKFRTLGEIFAKGKTKHPKLVIFFVCLFVCLFLLLLFSVNYPKNPGFILENEQFSRNFKNLISVNKNKISVSCS